MTEEFEARLALFENSKDKVTQFMTYFLSTILLILNQNFS